MVSMQIQDVKLTDEEYQTRKLDEKSSVNISVPEIETVDKQLSVKINFAKMESYKQNTVDQEDELKLQDQSVQDFQSIKSSSSDSENIFQEQNKSDLKLLSNKQAPNQDHTQVPKLPFDMKKVLGGAPVLADLIADKSAIEEREQVHKDNDIGKNQCRSAKQFMKKVMYEVPLNKLYQVMESCQYTKDAEFCPVLVKIIDKTILKENGGKQFLLQVWTIKGLMIYERPLDKPVANWNIAENKLIFMEETYSQEVFLVKLAHDEEPVVFKINLPAQVTQGKINSFYDPVAQNFVIPEDSYLNKTNPDVGNQLKISRNSKTLWLSMKIDQDQMRKLGEVQKEQSDESVQFQESEQFFEIEESKRDLLNQIIVRAPDKMIDYKTGFVLVAFRNQIVYINIQDLDIEFIQKSDDVIVKDVSDDQVDLINLQEHYKIISLQESSDLTSTSLVLEDLQTGQIRFLQVQITEDEQETKKLKFIQKGIIVNKTQLTQSPLMKYRQISKIDPQTNQKYTVAVVLRENRRFEVYSDYVLVSEYVNPKKQCVDIETDFDQFYLKFVKVDLKNPKQPLRNLEFEIRRVRHFWRNRISFSTTKEVTNQQKWNSVIHNRIALYFRLYTQILNFSMYMLVSHRNMISIFEMTKIQRADQHAMDIVQQKINQFSFLAQKSLKSFKQDIKSFEKDNSSSGYWKQTMKLDKSHVREIIIKKVPEIERRINSQNEEAQSGVFDTFRIVCITGQNLIHTCRLNNLGKMSKISSQWAPGRIIRLNNDKQYKNGILLLTDKEQQYVDYDLKGDQLLYTFPYKMRENNSELTLYTFKKGSFYPLLTNQDNLKDCLNFDSDFQIMSADKNVFQVNRELFQEQNLSDEVEQAFQGQENCTVLLCLSRINRKRKIFPIVTQYQVDNKTIEQILLIKNSYNCKEIEYSQEEAATQPVSNKVLLADFVQKEEFGSNKKDNLIIVTENQIQIYDNRMQRHLFYDGMSIRGCQIINQRYLYVISDKILEPPTITAYTEDGIQKQKQNFTVIQNGFYVYDLLQLFQGKLDMYKLVSTISGQCNFIARNKLDDRVSFIQNFKDIVSIPLPHLNLIRCVGMGQKKEFMIWREKNGFFTALDRQCNLLTWSLLTGKMLYNDAQKEDASYEQLKLYEVFQADENDITYTRNFYNQKESSLSLLKSKVAVNLQNYHSFVSQKYQVITETLMKQQLDTQQFRNIRGSIKLNKSVKKLQDDLFTTQSENINIQVQNSQHESEFYHFKVMELKTLEDEKIETKFNQCKLRFHFYFELLKASSGLGIESSKPQQRLYLSQDTQKLMEVINNETATIYYRVKVESSDCNREEFKQTEIQSLEQKDKQEESLQYKWMVAYKINRYPKALCQDTSIPYLFSPNFSFQFDFDYREKQFLIKNSSTQFVYMKISKDLFSTAWMNLQGEQSIKMICSRFKWESERTFRLVNQGNLDCIFEMCTTDGYKDTDIQKRYLKLISVVKVDNLHENITTLDSPNLLSHRVTLDQTKVLERLIRCSQDYKTKLRHARNLGHKDFKLHSQINKIDYSQDWSNQKSSFDIETSFTWLDWRIMEMVDSDVHFEIHNFSEKQEIQMLFNILPKGRSMLHLLALSTQGNTGDYTSSDLVAKDLFYQAGRLHQAQITGASNGCNFEVPILPDEYGNTCLDFCLGLTRKSDDLGIFKIKKLYEQGYKSSKNIAVAEEIFKGIKDYGFLHSSYLITDAVIEATRLSITSISAYLEGRFKIDQHILRTQTQKCIKENIIIESPSMGKYARLYTKMVVSETQVKAQLFDESQHLQPMQLQYLDIPFVYQQTQAGFDFIQALAQCQDIEIFGLKSVQVLIDSQHPKWRNLSRYFIGIPIVVQLLVFTFWSNIVLARIDDFPDELQYYNKICKYSLVIIAVYLVIIELSIAVRTHIKYFYNPVQLFNLITPATIIVSVNSSEYDLTKQFWTLQTWTALTIWIRFMFYLRSTTQTYGWMIRMIQNTFFNMLSFIAIFFIGILAFADAFESISQIMELEGYHYYKQTADGRGNIYEVISNFTAKYVHYLKSSFLVALGEFDVDLEHYRNQDWLVFLLCCLFNIIVLLNLLIAIISETYTRISQKANQTSYKEKALFIGMMQNSIFGLGKKKPDPTDLLFIAKEFEKQETSEETTTISDRINQLEAKIDSNTDMLSSFIELMKEKKSASSNEEGKLVQKQE